MEMTEQDYYVASEDGEGYCTECNELTRSGVEPDARGYLCPACGCRTVMGLEDALVQGLVELTWLKAATRSST